MEPAQDATALPERSRIRLTVPAHGAFLSLIRTTTASVAARLNFTIDDIEDLRIAVDEAAAILLPAVSGDADVTVVFDADAERLRIVLAAPTGDAPAPDQSGFGWTVLAALAGSVTAEQADGITSIVLEHERATVTQGQP